MNRFRPLETAFKYPVYATRDAVIKAGLPDPGPFDPTRPLKMWATTDFDKEKTPTILYKAIVRVDDDEAKTTEVVFADYVVDRKFASKFNVPSGSTGENEDFRQKDTLPVPCYPIQENEYLGEMMGQVVIFDRTAVVPEERRHPGDLTAVEKAILVDAALVILGRKK